jgi:integrase
MVWLPAHCGQFLDCIEGERLFAVFIFTMFSGLRQDDVVGLDWAEIDLDEAVAYVRHTSSGDDPKSGAGVRVVSLPKVVVEAMKSWRRRQAAERLAWGPDWPDSGRVFTQEDGMPVTGQWLSRKFATLAWRAELPCVRFHDLRHGAASLAKAAGASSKSISEQLGHSRQSFTDTTYVTVFPDVAKAAAEAVAALVPRKNLAENS